MPPTHCILRLGQQGRGQPWGHPLRAQQPRVVGKLSEQTWVREGVWWAGGEGGAGGLQGGGRGPTDGERGQVAVRLQQPAHVGRGQDVGHSGQLLGGAGGGAADAIGCCHGAAAGCGPDCRLGCRPTAGCTAAPAVWPRLGPPCTRTDAAAAGSRPVLARPRLPAGPCLPTAPPSLCRPQTPPCPPSLPCRGPLRSSGVQGSAGCTTALLHRPPAAGRRRGKRVPSSTPAGRLATSLAILLACMDPTTVNETLHPSPVLTDIYCPPTPPTRLYLFTLGPAVWLQLRESWSWNDGEAPTAPTYHAPC